MHSGQLTVPFRDLPSFPPECVTTVELSAQYVRWTNFEAHLYENARLSVGLATPARNRLNRILRRSGARYSSGKTQTPVSEAHERPRAHQSIEVGSIALSPLQYHRSPDTPGNLLGVGAVTVPERRVHVVTSFTSGCIPYRQITRTRDMLSRGCLCDDLVRVRERRLPPSPRREIWGAFSKASDTNSPTVRLRHLDSWGCEHQGFSRSCVQFWISKETAERVRAAASRSRRSLAVFRIAFRPAPLFFPCSSGLEFHPTAELVRIYLDEIAFSITVDPVQLTSASFIAGVLKTNSSAKFAFSGLRSRKTHTTESAQERA